MYGHMDECQPMDFTLSFNLPRVANPGTEKVLTKIRQSARLIKLNKQLVHMVWVKTYIESPYILRR